MAKKKAENQLTYLQMPLPSGKKSYKMTKRAWTGLNYRHTIDSGALSMEKNISTLEAPALVPATVPHDIGYGIDNVPIGMFGFGDILILIYRRDTTIYVKWLREEIFDDGSVDIVEYTSVLKRNATEADEYPRCVVQFNVYTNPTDPISGAYDKRLLIFPDKKAMDLEVSGDNFQIDNMDETMTIKKFTPAEGTDLPSDKLSHNYCYISTATQKIYKWVDDHSDSSKSGWQETVPPSIPPIKHATVHLSRLFGVDDGRVYASGFNDYANWNLDTVDEYNESNAWCSPAQSNTKADGKFTGITTYQGHVICFKRGFMHEIYNTKNPFRIQDIFADGTIDHRTVQEVNGKLIFVSDDDVKVYTGSNPRSIGYNLNISKFIDAVSGADDRCYYLYCQATDCNGKTSRRLLVYDTYTDAWSERSVTDKVLNFTLWMDHMWMLCANGYFYCLSYNAYNHNWSFETDLITNQTVDIKHIKKMQMLADFGTNAKMSVYFLYDDEVFSSLTTAEKADRLMYQSSGAGRKTIRVKPRKTANYGIKLHVEGYGYVKLYELELFMENGGGLYV